MNKRDLLVGIGGLLVGFGLGFITNHFYNNKKKDKLVDKVVNDALKELGMGVEETEKEEPHELSGKEILEGKGREETEFVKRRNMIKALTEKDVLGKTDYGNMYTHKGGVPTITVNLDELDEKEEEDVEDADGVEEEEDEMEAYLDWDLINFKESHKGKKPKIISEKTYNDLPEFIERVQLYFYVHTQDLVGDDDELLTYEEEQILIGDSLTKYDWADQQNEEEVLYVLNYTLPRVYCIEKKWEAYDDIMEWVEKEAQQYEQGNF